MKQLIMINIIIFIYHFNNMNKKNISLFLISLLYIISGIGKIFNFYPTVNLLHSRPIFNLFPKEISLLAIIITIGLLICGPIIIYLDISDIITKIFLWSLILFTILATLLFHFPDSKDQFIHFLKNTAIIGGWISLL